jgi:hypothetical protein
MSPPLLTTCKRGHPMAGLNLMIYRHKNSRKKREGEVYRKCRECNRLRSLDHMRRRRALDMREAVAS